MACKRKRLRFAQVSYKRHEFVRQKGKRLQGLSNLVGTQSIDSRWHRLERYIPKELKVRRMADDGRKELNDDLIVYARSWQWRSWRHSKDLFEELGQGIATLRKT